MTQTQLIVLLLKIGLVSGGVVLVAWVAVYSKLTRGGAWRNPLGLSLILEVLLIAGLFVPQILSLFFNLTRLDSRIAAWADVALIGLVTPVMLWRTIAFLRIGPLPKHKAPDSQLDGIVPPSPQEWSEDGAS